MEESLSLTISIRNHPLESGFIRRGKGIPSFTYFVLLIRIMKGVNSRVILSINVKKNQGVFW